MNDKNETLESIRKKRSAKTEQLVNRDRNAIVGFSPLGNVVFVRECKLDSSEVLNIARRNQRKK